MNFNDDDIVIWIDGSIYFGSAFEGIMILEDEIYDIISPDDEDYWDYFFDIEE